MEGGKDSGIQEVFLCTILDNCGFGQEIGEEEVGADLFMMIEMGDAVFLDSGVEFSYIVPESCQLHGIGTVFQVLFGFCHVLVQIQCMMGIVLVNVSGIQMRIMRRQEMSVDGFVSTGSQDDGMPSLPEIGWLEGIEPGCLFRVIENQWIGTDNADAAEDGVILFQFFQ